MARNGDTKSPGNSGSTLGIEANLWAATDKMRGYMDASEYKHDCLGLIFLKYISDAFEEKRGQPSLALLFPDISEFTDGERVPRVGDCPTGYARRQHTRP